MLQILNRQSGSSESVSDNKIGDIQVLRAVAIALVLLQHLSITATINDSFPSHGTMPFWSGVELFFVISGLVVTRSALGKDIDPFSFFLKRLFRLWPAILFFNLLSAAVVSLAILCPPGTWGRDALATTPGTFAREALATFGGYYINIPGRLYTHGQIWSLAVEFQFYAAFTLWMLALRAFSFRGEVTKKATISVAATLYLLALVQRVGGAIGLAPIDNAIINYIVSWRFDFLLVGVIISHVVRRPLAFSQSIATAMIFLPLSIVSISEPIMQAGPKPLLNGVGYPLMAVCFAILCLLAKSNNAFDGHKTKVYKALCWIGDRSYSIYLIHFPVMALQWMMLYWLAPARLASTAMAYGICQAVFVLPVTLLLSDFCFKFVETPGRKFGHRLIGVFKTKPSNPTPAPLS